jgi:hypothetical protein
LYNIYQKPGDVGRLISLGKFLVYLLQLKILFLDMLKQKLIGGPMQHILIERELKEEQLLIKQYVKKILVD